MKTEARSLSTTFSKYRSSPRKVVVMTSETMIKTSYLNENSFPLVIEPAVENVNLVNWAEGQREFIEAQLLKHGALLFRNFNVKSALGFEAFIKAVSGELIEYKERSSPRSQVIGNIYTSTDYPPEQAIFLHNEQSYNCLFPLRIFFYCEHAAPVGGETPIADTRKIFAWLNPQIRDRLIEKNYMYVRNYGDGCGLPWQTVFQTDNTLEVESYCRLNHVNFQWKDNLRLKTSQVRRVAGKHPRSGEMAWFNHLTFFHISTLLPEIRDAMVAQFDEDDLPNNTYYGDGSRIESSVMDELGEAYLGEKLSFPWQQSDVLMLDNMLSSHGREPYSGPRKVLVGMADIHNWANIL
jgi:alpha-ketoglutarate-dependent taurine dioxygenase